MTRDGRNSPDLPAPVGPYSHAVHAGEFVYLSGQTGVDPATKELVAGSIAAQAEQVFRNLETVLTTVGLSFDQVVKVNVFLINMADFGAMNAVYASHFTAPYPARSTVAVAALPGGAQVEIELIARRD